MGTLIILSENGDDKLEWDINDPESVRVACAKFLDLRKQGFFIYRVIESSEQEEPDFNPNAPPLFVRSMVKSGEQTNEFDKDAKKLIATPPMVGG